MVLNHEVVPKYLQYSTRATLRLTLKSLPSMHSTHALLPSLPSRLPEGKGEVVLVVQCSADVLCPVPSDFTFPLGRRSTSS